MAALAASGIEVETNTPILGQLAKPAQQLVARHGTSIAVDATRVKGHTCEIPERSG
jgi:hypothetical protein